MIDLLRIEPIKKSSNLASKASFATPSIFKELRNLSALQASVPSNRDGVTPLKKQVSYYTNYQK
jgi:hypothetical protein